MKSLETVKVILTKGKVAIIDAADAPKVLQFKWTAMKIYRRKREMFYARRGVKINGKQKTILLHRFILDAPDGVEVDHENGDGLDCRRLNLRLATKSQNRANAQQIKGTINYRGVIKTKGKKRPFGAKLTFEGKTYNLGVFGTAEAAAKAYDLKAREVHGEFASLNFPDEPTVEEIEKVEKEIASEIEAWRYLNEVL